jgi:hypothetical protein
VKVVAICASLASVRPWDSIQSEMAESADAAAWGTASVCFCARKPSMKPRTASSAATRPPEVPETPSAMAAIMPSLSRLSRVPR